MATRKSAARVPAKIGFVESMECLPVSALPEGRNWSYEIKLYRLATGVWTWNFAGENMR
jgi:hypothetical protein